MYLVEYNSVTAWPGKSKPSFWEWIDTKLVKLRKLPKQDQEAALRSNFRKDKKKFPIPVDGQSSFPTVVKPQDWQADIAVAVLVMAEQVESVPRQRAPRSKTSGSRRTPAVGAVPDAGTPDNRQDQSEHERADDQQEEEPATGTQSEPDEGPLTGWGHQNLDRAPMDVERHPVGPPAGCREF
ncbi:hypothetical protein FRC10_006469, partial [Ceratobasidium sp. 414]